MSVKPVAGNVDCRGQLKPLALRHVLLIYPPTTTLQYKYKSRHKSGDKLTEGLKGDLYHILSYMPPEMGRYMMDRRWRGLSAGSLCCTWRTLRISCPQDLLSMSHTVYKDVNFESHMLHISCYMSVIRSSIPPNLDPWPRRLAA